MSALALTQEQLRAALGVKEIVVLSKDDDVRASIESARYGSELWRWFLLAAIIALVVEMLLYRGGAADTTAHAGKVRSRAFGRKSQQVVGS